MVREASGRLAHAAGHIRSSVWRTEEREGGGRGRNCKVLQEDLLHSTRCGPSEDVLNL